MDNKEILNFLKDHKQEIRNQYNIIILGLFGSFAQNKQSQESDIDLLVKFADNTNDIFEKKQDLKTFLKNKFKRDVDICTIKYIKPYLKEHILKQAVYV